jgi:hypothetical protein
MIRAWIWRPRKDDFEFSERERATAMAVESLPTERYEHEEQDLEL